MTSKINSIKLLLILLFLIPLFACEDESFILNDNKLVLPINKNIHVLVTAGDVLHSFAMPSLGVKKDAVPGRLNETWMNIEKTGIYRGQCSELCGTGSF